MPDLTQGNRAAGTPSKGPVCWPPVEDFEPPAGVPSFGTTNDLDAALFWIR